MFYSLYPYDLGMSEVEVYETRGRYQFEDDAPEAFAGKVVPVRIVLTNEALALEARKKPLFRPEEYASGSIGLNQIKMVYGNPAAETKGNQVHVQTLAGPVVFAFMNHEEAAALTRKIWDTMTGTTEIQRQLSSVVKTTTSVLFDAGKAITAGLAAGLAESLSSKNRKR